MAHIKPFQGIRYNLAKIEDLAAVTAPLYDLIEEEEKEHYYNRSPYNIIRLILGKDCPYDDHERNRYNRASVIFKSWLRDGVLIQDATPSLYLYEQEYEVRGQRKRLLSFIAITRLEEEESKVVVGHEHTFLKNQWDRLRLLQACEANLCPIISLYPDPQGRINHLLREYKSSSKPVLSFHEPMGAHHTLWLLRDEALIKEIQEELRPKNLLIADGHHRYETAKIYRDLMKMENPHHRGEEPYDYVMMLLVNMEGEDGLCILPIHRLIKGLEGDYQPLLLDIIRDCFELQSHPNGKVLLPQGFIEELKRQGQERATIGLFMEPEQFFLLSLRDKSPLEMPIDANLLHELILKRLLENQPKATIAYSHEEQEVVDFVRGGSYQLGFFLNPPEIKTIKELAEKGKKLPQKTTFFYPKPLSGFVIRKIS